MNFVDTIIENSEKILNGKQEQIKLALCAFLSQGHVLIEDVPGVGKTTLVKSLGHYLGLEVSRIQFTNDILPSDITGTNIFNKDNHQFEFQKGPIFGEVILADELNRAPAKTQSALLQAMEEKKISSDNHTFELSPYFTVFATQNPHSQIGTYELPESQLDRFTIKFSLGYPDKKDSILMLKEKSIAPIEVNNKSVITKEKIKEVHQEVENIYVDDSIFEYVYELLDYTRQSDQTLPLSNRCGIDLIKTAKAWSYINHQDHVNCDHVHYIFSYVAGHRLLHPGQSSTHKEQKICQKILSEVPIRK